MYVSNKNENFVEFRSNTIKVEKIKSFLSLTRFSRALVWQVSDRKCYLSQNIDYLSYYVHSNRIHNILEFVRRARTHWSLMILLLLLKLACNCFWNSNTPLTCTIIPALSIIMTKVIKVMGELYSIDNNDGCSCNSAK
jgi:hypothetical protein